MSDDDLDSLALQARRLHYQVEDARLERVGPPRQSDLFGLSGRTDAPDVLADMQVDYTPCAVAVQLLISLIVNLGLMDLVPRLRSRPWPVTALDPSAGSGCWGRAMRAVLANHIAKIVGIEPRKDESANLAAAYDVGLLTTLEEASLTDTFDLVASNPPFGEALRTTSERPWWPGLLLQRGVLARDAIVAFYGPSQWGQGDEHQALFAEWCPSLQIRVGGRVGHRGNGCKDMRELSLWVWSMFDRARRAARDRSWRVVQLDVLPAGLREWSPAAIPGTYPIDASFVNEIARKYV